MAVGRLAKATLAAALAAGLAGCAGPPGSDAPPRPEPRPGPAAKAAPKAAPKTAPKPAGRGAEELRVSFVDMLAPGAFDWTGPAVAVAGGAEGLWVVLPGATHAERVRVRLLDGEGDGAAGGASVDVALFRGPAGPGGAARLSAAAAEALGVSGPARVRVTALRREPRLVEAAKPAPAPAAWGPARLWPF